MFGSKKRTKHKAPEVPKTDGGVKHPSMELNTGDQDVDTTLVKNASNPSSAINVPVEDDPSSDSKPRLVVNASDDFKIDSLRKKAPDVLALSGCNVMDNNNETIPEPLPDYPTSPDSQDEEFPPPPLPSPLAPMNGPSLAPSSVILDHDKDITVVSTIPSDQDNRKSYGSETDVELDDDSKYGDDRTQVRWKKNIKGSLEGLDNPVFQEEEKPVPRSKISAKRELKSKQDQFPGLRKKVSWNNTVVYTSGTKTDIVIDGLHEEESETDSSPNGSPRNSGLSAVPRNGSATFRSPERGGKGTKAHKGRKTDYKCSVCCAVVLISLAMVGIVVLGTMYGVRYANEKTTSDKIEDIKQTFALLPSGASSVFMFTLYRPPADQSQDGATYFLLEKDSIMPWQSPEVSATLVWLRGEAVKVHIFDRRGRVLVRVLGDPMSMPGAQFTLHMTDTDWYGAKLLKSDSYALVALSQDSSSRTWRDADVTQLLGRISSNALQSTIKEFARPRV